MTSTIANLPTTDLAETRSVSTQAMVFDPQVIEGMYRMAEMMAAARVTVPKHLAGSPGDCLAVIMQAAQFKMNPFAVAQKTYIVGGTLGYEAQLVNAVVANSGAIKGRFHYEYRGEGQSVECRVGAVIAGERDITWTEWLSAASVQTKNSPLWKTNPRQQLGYLQVKNWARLYAPGAILGVYTVDELSDSEPREMGVAQVVDEPAPSTSRTESVKAKLAAKARREPAAPAADLDDVLSAIAAAETLDALKTTAGLASKLADQAHKATARQAYADRKTALEQQTAPPAEDPQADAQTDAAPDSAAWILTGIAAAETADLVADWEEEARLADLTPEERAAIDQAAESRRAELAGG